MSIDLERQPNDFCSTAKEIMVSNTTESAISFEGATVDTDVPWGGDNLPLGIWYSLEGTGLSYLIQFQVSSGDEWGLAAYSGSCGALDIVQNALPV